MKWSGEVKKRGERGGETGGETGREKRSSMFPRRNEIAGEITIYLFKGNLISSISLEINITISYSQYILLEVYFD